MADTLLHSHTLVDEFHANTWEDEQPPSSLTPSEDSSKPEFELLLALVPVVTISREMVSAPTTIPFPAPISKVKSPVAPPPDKPDPAVTEVISPRYVSVVRYAGSDPDVQSPSLNTRPFTVDDAPIVPSLEK